MTFRKNSYHFSANHDPTFKVDEIAWKPNPIFNLHVGFCPSELAWRKYTAEGHFGDNNNNPYDYDPPRVAAMHYYPENNVHAHIAIVLFSEHLDQKYIDGNGVENTAAIMAHEAFHLSESLCETMGERFPSSEFRAYAIQWYTAFLMDAYVQTRIYPKVQEIERERENHNNDIWSTG